MEVEKLKLNIVSMDMTDDMKYKIVDISKVALQKHSIEKDIAQFIKENLDKEYKSNFWHVIVGRQFGR